MIKRFLLCGLVIVFYISSAWASGPIKITLSDKMDQVIFDGRWTHETEWKRSSQDTISYVELNEQFQLRTAHQDNFIYVMIDFVTDNDIDLGKDSATVCLDIKNDKTQIPNENDFCFTTILGETKSMILQGNDEKIFKEISNEYGFIAIGTSSDENDHYSPLPHTSYEFKIPTDLVSRSNIYGFYVGVYDASLNKTFSWPTEINLEYSSEIPSPSMWGEIISPDKSLPEFNLPILALLPALIAIILLSRFKFTTKQNVF
jgi:hypothetical protein